MRGGVTDAGRKIELLSQWRLEAELRNFKFLVKPKNDPKGPKMQNKPNLFLNKWFQKEGGSLFGENCQIIPYPYLSASLKSFAMLGVGKVKAWLITRNTPSSFTGSCASVTYIEVGELLLSAPLPLFCIGVHNPNSYI